MQLRDKVGETCFTEYFSTCRANYNREIIKFITATCDFHRCSSNHEHLIAALSVKNLILTHSDCLISGLPPA